MSRTHPLSRTSKAARDSRDEGSQGTSRSFSVAGALLGVARLFSKNRALAATLHGSRYPGIEQLVALVEHLEPATGVDCRRLLPKLTPQSRVLPEGHACEPFFFADFRPNKIGLVLPVPVPRAFRVPPLDDRRLLSAAVVVGVAEEAVAREKAPALTSNGEVPGRLRVAESVHGTYRGYLAHAANLLAQTAFNARHLDDVSPEHVADMVAWCQVRADVAHRLLKALEANPGAQTRDGMLICQKLRETHASLEQALAPRADVAAV